MASIVRSPTPGDALLFRGKVTDLGGKPIAGQSSTGGTVGIKRIRFAFEPPGGLDRPGHLDDLDGSNCECSGEPGAIAGRALDPDPDKRFDSC